MHKCNCFVRLGAIFVSHAGETDHTIYLSVVFGDMSLSYHTLSYFHLPAVPQRNSPIFQRGIILGKIFIREHEFSCIDCETPVIVLFFCYSVKYCTHLNLN